MTYLSCYMLNLCHFPIRKIFLLSVLGASVGAQASASAPVLFERDTFAFANDTVFAYRDGHPSVRQESSNRYTTRCFVMSRAVVQFRKFARFDPALPALDDAALADRIRAVTGRAPWRDELDDARRIVIPGVRDLRDLSRTRTRVVQENIGLGWPTYFRLGNWRVVLPKLPGQQERTQARLEQAMTHGQYYVAYMTTMPNYLYTNHAVLVLNRHGDDGENIGYGVYDPASPEAPRTLYWSKRARTFWYPPNPTFIGGSVYVWRVYGAPLQ